MTNSKSKATISGTSLSTEGGVGQDHHVSSRSILVDEVIKGLGELRRSATGLFLSGLSAGLDVGFSVLLMAVALTSLHGEASDAVIRFTIANLYAVGFILVVIGRSELFTEHTALAVFPVLDGRASVRRLLRLWGIIYAANILGAGVFAAILSVIGPRLGVVAPESLDIIAHHLIDHDWWVILCSGLLAGWLMGLLSWLVSASQETVSQIVCVWLVTASIGLAGLHHCIVGSVEVLAAVFAGTGVTLGDYGHFLLWTTLGNAVGGVVFVAAVKYGHAVRTYGEPVEIE